jgi:3-oxoacyl-[acyl-carrier-protein] synthase III
MDNLHGQSSIVIFFTGDKTYMQVDIPLKISGLGRYLPKRIVPSSELEAMCGVPAGWVERRNGVRERRWVTDETSSFMSAEAAREALEEAKLKPNQLDLIINASGTGEQAIPDTGVLIQRQLGLGNSGIPAMTVHTTCLSFVAGMDVASNFIHSGRYKNILICSATWLRAASIPKNLSLLHWWAMRRRRLWSLARSRAMPRKFIIRISSHLAMART